MALRVLKNSNCRLTQFYPAASAIENKFFPTAACGLLQTNEVWRKPAHRHLVSVNLPKQPRIRDIKEKKWNRLQQMHKYWNEEISPENVQFIKQVVEENYKDSPLKVKPVERVEWNPLIRRSGVLCRKIGVHPQYTLNGERIMGTLLQVCDNHIIKCFDKTEYAKTKEGAEKGYGKFGCVVVGGENLDPMKLTASYIGLFTESGVHPKRKLARFRISQQSLLEPGTPLYAGHFKAGQYVDAIGKTIFHGFQGVMKRWGHKGKGKGGRTKDHRRVGSIGFSRHGARVLPGKKMPGIMGGKFRTILGLKILRINHDLNVIWVRGCAIPGGPNSYVYLRDTMCKKKRSSMLGLKLPMPTYYPEDDEARQTEEFDGSVFRYEMPTIEFKEEIKKTLPKTGAKTALRRK